MPRLDHDEGLRERLERAVRSSRRNDVRRGRGPVGDDMPQNLAAALVREATKSSDRPLSQILLISDGMQLGSTELTRAIAELPAPVSTLCVGDADVRDVILHGVSVPPYVYAGDRALVTAEVRSLGYSGDAISPALSNLAGTGETPVADPIRTSRSRRATSPPVARVQFVASTAGHCSATSFASCRWRMN